MGVSAPIYQPAPNFVMNAATINASATLTTEEKLYLNQLINAGVSLADFLKPYVQGNNMHYQGAWRFYPQGQVVTAFDAAKFAYAQDNIDFDTALINKLRSVGVNVDLHTGTTTVIGELVPFDNLAAATKTAVQTGKGMQEAFDQMFNSMDFGYNTTQIRAFFANPANNTAIHQAVYALNYPLPEKGDQDGINQMTQVYWAAFYLQKYPLKSDYSGDDCGVILETLKALSAERTNIAQGSVDQLFTTYSRNDWDQRSTAVSDLISRFNALDAKYNCTGQVASDINKNANTQLTKQLSGIGLPAGNDLLIYALLGTAAIVCIVIIVRKSNNN